MPAEEFTMSMNVPIGDEFARIVEKKVESGLYGSAQEVVEDALRNLELDQQSDEEKLAWLRQAWDEGVASGDAGELDIEEVIAEARRNWKPESRGCGFGLLAEPRSTLSKYGSTSHGIAPRRPPKS